MVLVDGQNSDDKGSVAPQLPARGVAAGAAKVGCQQAQAAVAVAGQDGASALPMISGCFLCQRSIRVLPAMPWGASLGGRNRAWPPREPDCPFLAHPSNQRRLAALAARQVSKDADGEDCCRMLS